MATYRPVVQMGADAEVSPKLNSWVFRDGAELDIHGQWKPRSIAARGYYSPTHWASRALGPDTGKDVGIFASEVQSA